MIIAVLKLIRYKNLSIFAFTQILFKYCFLNKYNYNPQLTTPLFLVLLFSFLFLAAAGYIINDIYDLETDKINKPEKVIIGKSIHKKFALKIYILFNIIGLLLAYYLSHSIHHPLYALLFLATAFCLLKYAQSWKNIFVLKNILIAFLTSLSILILGLYDIILRVDNQYMFHRFVILKIIFFYFLFSFLTNYIREIVKDIVDINGDKLRNTQSFVAKIGLSKTRTIVNILNLSLIIFLMSFILNYFINSYLEFIYIIVFVLLPMVIYSITFLKAKSKNNYHTSKQLLKWIMVFGIISIVFLKL